MKNMAFRKNSQQISYGSQKSIVKKCKKFQNIGQKGDFRFFVHRNVQANSLGSKLWTYSRNSRSLWCRFDDSITHCERIYIQRFEGGLSSL